MDAPRALLVSVDSSAESQDTLRFACELARACGASLTVLSVAVLEQQRRGCCDTRTTLWNDVQRDVAAEALEAARARVEGADVEFISAAGDDLAAVIEAEARARACDAIVVPRRRTRLRRKNRLEAVLRANTSLRVITPDELDGLSA